MKLARAQELAKAKGFSLIWDENFKIYSLLPINSVRGSYPVGLRASWIAIIDETEFIRDYLTTTQV